MHSLQLLCVTRLQAPITQRQRSVRIPRYNESTCLNDYLSQKASDDPQHPSRQRSDEA